MKKLLLMAAVLTALPMAAMADGVCPTPDQIMNNSSDIFGSDGAYAVANGVFRLSGNYNDPTQGKLESKIDYVDTNPYNLPAQYTVESVNNGTHGIKGSVHFSHQDGNYCYYVVYTTFINNMPKALNMTIWLGPEKSN